VKAPKSERELATEESAATYLRKTI
jgi:hypothetical protein